MMKVVLELSVKSYSETVRLRARTVFMEYLNTAGILKLKKINSLVDKLIENAQNFEHEYGRESAFLMIGLLPDKMFIDNSEHLLLSLSLAITKESSFGNSYKAALAAYHKLLVVNKVHNKTSKFHSRYSEIVLDAWILREGSEKTHVVGLNSLIVFTGLKEVNEDNDELAGSKMVNKISNGVMKKYTDTTSSLVRMKLVKSFYNKLGDVNGLEKWILNNYEVFLESESVETKLLICEIIGLILSKNPDMCKPEQVKFTSFIKNIGCENEDYTPHSKSLSTQSLKNLIALSKTNGIDTNFAKSMTEMARFEAANCPGETAKRTAFMKFLAAVVDEKMEKEITVELFGPLQREMQNIDLKQSSEDLKQLSKEVVEYLKSKTLGEGVFAEFYGEACKRASDRKHEREKKVTLEVGNNPELLAARKIKRNQRTLEKRGNRMKKEMDAVKLKKRKMVLDELDDL